MFFQSATSLTTRLVRSCLSRKLELASTPLVLPARGQSWAEEACQGEASPEEACQGEVKSLPSLGPGRLSENIFSHKYFHICTFSKTAKDQRWAAWRRSNNSSFGIFWIFLSQTNKHSTAQEQETKDPQRLFWQGKLEARGRAQEISSSLSSASS